MQNYEYKVIPAPTNGTKAKGVKTAQGRFAMTLEVLMNQMAAEGWEFQRAETLPSEERTGLMSKSTSYRNVLVFRRVSDVAAQASATPVILPVAEVDTVDDLESEPASAPDYTEETLEETIVDPDVAQEDVAEEAEEDVRRPQPLIAQRD